MNETKSAVTGEGKASRFSEENAVRDAEKLEKAEAQRDELLGVVRAVRCKLYTEKELFDMACEVLDSQDAAIAKVEGAAK